MYYRVAFGLLLLAACDPVVLVGEGPGGADSARQKTLQTAGVGAAPPPRDAVVAGAIAITDSDGATAQPSAAPDVVLIIKSSDCGSCFDVVASGQGGSPPYQYEWEDGSTSDTRRVCVDANDVDVTVTAQDGLGTRSEPRMASLQPNGDGSGACDQPPPPATLCLTNPSFEGTAAVNGGQNFDAQPWSACTDAASGNNTNTPDIASDTLDPASGIAPQPRDGSTYLALATGEQASEQLCSTLAAQESSSVRLDAMRFDIGGADMYLQIWGGDALSCSQRLLLWRSPALTTSWQNYCVTLRPSEPIDQVTLRAETPMPLPGLMTAYLAVDNLVPVASCP